MAKLLIKILLCCAVLVPILVAYRYQSLNPHFVDEEDNFVLGMYILKGEKLYSDLFSHHQPLAYLMSSGVQAVTSPNSLFLLVKRHREFIMIWALIWSIWLVIKFSWPLLLFVATFEIGKFHLFGNLFLSESLAVYPLVYLSSLVIKKCQNLRKMEVLFVGFSLVTAFLLLSPGWPLLVLISLVLLTRLRLFQGKRWMWLIAGGILPVLLVLPFISVRDYLFTAFWINFRYYIPMTTHQSLLSSFFQSLVSPITALIALDNQTQTLYVIKAASSLFIIYLLYLLKRRQFQLILISLLVLAFSNIRYVQPGMQEYSGFHLLPWFAMLISATFLLGERIFQQVSNRFAKSIVLILAFTVLGTSLFFSGDLFRKRDLNLDWYINYSRQFDFGEAIKVMKVDDNETLMVVPDDWLIYWQADIKHASWMVNYYAWMAMVPEIKGPLETSFSQKPPTYFYCDCRLGYFGLEKYFPLYQALEKDGQKTKLLVLSTKLNSLTPEQKNKLRYWRFQIN